MNIRHPRRADLDMTPDVSREVRPAALWQVSVVHWGNFGATWRTAEASADIIGRSMTMISPNASLAPCFTHPSYLVRKKALKLLGGKVDIYAPDGTPVLCSLQKAFRLKEDIRLYSDDRKSQELLTISARQIMDFSAAYDVVDAPTGVRLGALRRKGWASLVQDKWEVLDPADQVVATVEEESLALALIRRLATNLIPQRYDFKNLQGQVIAEGNQHFNPFIYKLDLKMQMPGAPQVLDPRLVLASAVLLALIEGRESG
ncbi:MAG: hypothetical protein ACYC63_18890 [Armatimonadota bacterium]